MDPRMCSGHSGKLTGVIWEVSVNDKVVKVGWIRLGKTECWVWDIEIDFESVDPSLWGLWSYYCKRLSDPHL